MSPSPLQGSDAARPPNPGLEDSAWATIRRPSRPQASASIPNGPKPLPAFGRVVHELRTAEEVAQGHEADGGVAAVGRVVAAVAEHETGAFGNRRPRIGGVLVRLGGQRDRIAAAGVRFLVHLARF